MTEGVSTVIEWLLDENNPAVRLRASAELKGQAHESADAAAWYKAFLPSDWMERKGLWSTYYLSGFAECGLTFADTGLEIKRAVGFGADAPFDCGCGDFMRLRALVRLGLGDYPAVASVIKRLPETQLPDGGFLCLHRLKKMDRVPKSCVKVNMHALMFAAECAKKGIATDITEPLVDYFWKHRLFYRTGEANALILSAREGWRAVDAFYPFEVMRVGLANIVESFCALGYGNDERLCEAWELLEGKRNPEGKYLLGGTLTKSYLPKERVGAPGKWVTLYALLAKKERGA
ncbi:MAG: hypothetical protein FWF03_07670 [Defluviitaleaceae bacterium]|nr:hypothetical protein [Defluviitaleaceae bacterium]